jgi:hypothetical protein
MLVFALSLFAAFVLAAVLTEDRSNDDDGPGGGMMIPATNPI